jgi:hypothetical protein
VSPSRGQQRRQISGSFRLWLVQLRSDSCSSLGRI